MKKNILYLNINSNLGGAERCLLEEISNLDKNKFNPIAGLFSKGHLGRELKKKNINCKIFRASKIFLNQSQESLNFQFLLTAPLIVIESLKVAKSISKFIEDNKISIVISNNFKTHLISCILKRLTNAKIIWRYHDSLPKNRLLRRMIASFAENIPDKIIVNSGFVRGQFLKNKVSRKKLAVVYPIYANRSHTSSKQSHNCRKTFKLTEKDFAVGCLGALVPWKGQEYLIKAAKLLKDKIPNLKVFIAGDEIYDTKAKTSKKYLMNLSKELGLEDIVVFTGFLKEPEKILNALNLVVHTSIKPEPFGRVIVEGMLCGKAVIATSAGGPLEIIKNNQTGLLIRPHNHKVLANIILGLYKSPKKRKLMGENARKYATQNFNSEEQIKKLEREYVGLIE